jgi:hypothetical protein
MHSARVPHAHGAGSAHTHSVCGPRSRPWRDPCAQRWPALAGPASACAAQDGAARRTPEWSPLSGHTSRRNRWQCHDDGGGTNGGGRAPTAVRLPAEHGEGENSSPELLVDGEGEKTGLAAAFFRRGGATVAGSGPATGRREGEVSSTLHG